MGPGGPYYMGAPKFYDTGMPPALNILWCVQLHGHALIRFSETILG
jgi:hypothetical protein